MKINHLQLFLTHLAPHRRWDITLIDIIYNTHMQIYTRKDINARSVRAFY